MPFPENQLSVEEVSRRLDNCSAPNSDELHSMGVMMLREIDERFIYLDSKANKLAGYCGAIVVFLVSTVREWSSTLDIYFVMNVVVAAVSILMAGVISLFATSVATANWLSPNDWFRSDFLARPSVELKKYWLLCMYATKQSYLAACDRKALLILRAQFLLSLAVGLLLVAVLLDAEMRLFVPLLDRACR